MFSVASDPSLRVFSSQPMARFRSHSNDSRQLVAINRFDCQPFHSFTSLNSIIFTSISLDLFSFLTTF